MPNGHHNSYINILKEKYNIDGVKAHAWTGNICSDIINDKSIEEHILKINIPIIYKIIAEQAENAECMDEWVYLSYQGLKESNLDSVNTGEFTIRNTFIKKKKFIEYMPTDYVNQLDKLSIMVKNRALARRQFWPDGVFVEPGKNVCIPEFDETIAWLQNKPVYVKRSTQVQNYMPKDLNKKIGLPTKAAAKKRNNITILTKKVQDPEGKIWNSGLDAAKHWFPFLYNQREEGAVRKVRNLVNSDDRRWKYI